VQPFFLSCSFRLISYIQNDYVSEQMNSKKSLLLKIIEKKIELNRG